MRNKIIFIDDHRIEPYYESVRRNLPDYDCHHFEFPGEAVEFIINERKQIFIIILDIMFNNEGIYSAGYNAGIDFYNQLKPGLNTGIDIYKLIKENILVDEFQKKLDYDKINAKDGNHLAEDLRKIKIIILTNRTRSEPEIKNFIDIVKKNEDLFFEKPFIKPSQLVEIIKGFNYE